MQLQEYCAKPKVRFFGKDTYFLGLELEMEAPDYDKKADGLNVLKRPGWCYAKEDGSLDDTGWELVTHPIARRSWLKKKATGAVRSFFSLVSGLRELKYTSHANGRAGLHIHVSQEAFGVDPRDYNKRKKMHLYWFCRLVNSELFFKLSQRHREHLDEFAAIQPVHTKDFFRMGEETKYVATNVTDHTVEVRLFRGNMREDRIRKAVESVVAAVEYSKGLGVKDYKKEKESRGSLVAGFLEYISGHKATYENLYNFLVEISVLKKEAATCA